MNRAPPLKFRPARQVMSMRRAGAAVPDALSFARSAMREIAGGRWRIEKLRFDLDAEGRGEVLYRFTDGRWTFHFFLVALKLDESQKMDRNWAQSWDAMGALCQGEWTPEREALLREEIPKQRNGYADYGTLVYARGNRSARFFDHVVEKLAAGKQPDLKLLARVGYILRTTAFIANGQLGTRAYAGLEDDHPFRRPYHVQMASAFLLREYVFDLVDHVARARNPKAARLDPAYRRYLGIGNAAATGLISFLVNHPHLVHRWTLAHEAALAAALQRKPDGPAFATLLRLVDRAIRYHREGEDERADLFATAGKMAADLSKLRKKLSAGVPVLWQHVTGWAEKHIGAEAVEIFLSLVLELHPDLAQAAADAFDTDERTETRPAMTAEALREILAARYGWALEQGYGEPTERFFWYRAANTPRENRRGLRAIAPELQSENGMDTARQARLLWKALAQAPAGTTVAELLCMRPELRHIVARVQSLADSEYAELQVNWLAREFSPFEPVRLILAFYGMEKYEAALPKSVRGSFLQGAPIAEDVREGREGDWPLPLIPAAGSHGVALDPLPAAGFGAVRNVPPPAPRRELRIAPAELARTAQTALQGHGAPLGVAEEGGAIVAFAHACGESALSALIEHCKAGLAPKGVATALVRHGDDWMLNARGASAFVVGPTAVDLACARGRVIVRNVRDPQFLGQLALRCAERGQFGLVQWRGGYAAAGPGEDGPWYARGAGEPPQHARDPGPREAIVLSLNTPAERLAWSGAKMRNSMRAWQREGLTIALGDYEALNQAAAALLVPVAEVPRLRPDEESDPLKVF